MTHEDYIAGIRSAVAPRITDEGARGRLMAAKVTYGVGRPGVRGVTYYGAWVNGEAPSDSHAFIEVCAAGESGVLQVAGTTIHECAHVIAGNTAGHGAAWKAACAALGLVRAEAAGQEYGVCDFDPDVYGAIKSLPEPRDGRPDFRGRDGAPLVIKPRPCPLGFGTRGGKSRGAGSGSRLLLAACRADACEYKVRITRRWIDDPEYGAPECPKHKIALTVGAAPEDPAPAPAGAEVSR